MLLMQKVCCDGAVLVVVVVFTFAALLSSSSGGAAGASPLDPVRHIKDFDLNAWINYFEPADYDPSALLAQHSRIRRSAKHRRQHVRLDIKGRDRVFQLILTPDDAGVFADDVAVESTRGVLNFDPKFVYSGTLRDDESATVHGIITKEGLFEGTISTKLEDYHVEPMSRYLMNASHHPSTNIHSIVYKTSDVMDPRRGLPCASHLLNVARTPKRRKKRWLLEAESKSPYDGPWRGNRTKQPHLLLPPLPPPYSPPFDLGGQQPIDEELDSGNRTAANVDVSNLIFRNVNKRATVDPKKTTCMLYLQADHQFFQKYGTEEACIEVMTRHVQRVNAIYKGTDFNQDGKADNITFMVKRIKVHTTDALRDPLYRFPNNYGVEKFLELFSGDCLWISKFMVIDMFKIKIVRSMLLVAIATQLFIYLFECSFFIVHPEYFMKYAPPLFARTYGFGAAIAILVGRGEVESLFDKGFDKWALDSVNGEFVRESKRIITVANTMAITVLTLGAFAGVFYFQSNCSDVEYYLIMFVVKQRLPVCSNLFNFVVKLLMVPIYYSMLVHCFLFAYGMQHTLMQVRMCAANMKGIIDDYPGKLEELIHDADFQTIIHRRFVFSIQRIVYMLSLKQSVNDRLVRLLFVMHVCNGVILGISVLLLMYEYRLGAYQNTISSKMICYTFLLQVCLSSCYLLYYGQQVENTSESVLKVVRDMEWYYFNEQNKKNVLMLWLIGSKPIRFDFSENFAINYKLGLGMVKAIYSVISLIVSSRKYRQVN